jgi:hypothetical protein
MILSVYLRDQPRIERELGVVLDLLQGVDDVDLIHLAFQHNKPALVNYDGQEAIVKKIEPFDDSHGFIGLFDVAISVADLRRMREQNPPTPEKPLADYDCEVEIRMVGTVPLSLMLRARDNDELQTRFRQLLASDPRFREAVQQCILDDITFHDHVEMVCRFVSSHVRHEEPDLTSPEWDINT